MARPVEILDQVRNLFTEVEQLKHAPGVSTGRERQQNTEAAETKLVELGFELAKSYLQELQDQTELLRTIADASQDLRRRSSVL